jgi:hypothetical protein
MTPYYFGSAAWQDEMIEAIKEKIKMKQELEPMDKVFLEVQAWHNSILYD